MPGLLSGSKALKGTIGSNSIFIALETAQPSLGITPTTGTGYTLVTGPNGQLGWTSTLGSIYFKDGLVRHQTSGSNIIIESNGTGSVIIRGNVLIENNSIISKYGSIDDFYANTATVNDLYVNRNINFSSASNTATFAGDVRVQRDFRVDRQFNAYGNVSLSPDGGIVEIEPAGAGTVSINPGTLGRIDNINIGDITPANGRFESLTATNLTVDSFTVTNSVATTGTFEYIRVTSTASDSVIIAGGAVVTGTLSAGALYDSELRVIRQISVGTDTAIYSNEGLVTIWSTATLQSLTNRGSTTTNAIDATGLYDTGVRVISQVIAGTGLSGGGNGPIVALTNTGVLSLTAGTDTSVSSTTGNIVVWNTSTLQSVTNRGWTTTNFMHIANGYSQVGTGTSLSGGTWTAAVFRVDGDAGIGGNLYIQGDFYASGKAVLTTSTLGGSLNQGDDIVITTNTSTGEITWDNVSTLQSVTGRGSTTTFSVHFANTSNSTSSATGSLYADGGVGVAKDVYVGGDVYSQGGGLPQYNYKLYTPRVTVSTSTPVDARIGDFWIDPSIGVEFQYVPNGTQTVWIQFIGF